MHLAGRLEFDQSKKYRNSTNLIYQTLSINHIGILARLDIISSINSFVTLK
jgi:hypothetical protein